MSMSNDRVRFYFPRHIAPAVESAAFKAFNMSPSQYQHTASYGVQVICRPSQFARFLILVGDNGGSGGARTFKAELFIPKPPVDEPVDVSKQPNKLSQICED